MTLAATGQANRTRPIVGVLLGDPSGIGPELAVKLLARPDNLSRADIVLLADGRSQKKSWTMGIAAVQTIAPGSST